MNKKIMIWIIVFLICVTSVLAIGLRPARTYLDFKPGLEKESGFWIVNNDQQDLSVNIYVKGELAKYVEINHKKAVLKEDEDSKWIDFKIKLPGKLPSGDVKADIIVEQDVSGGKSGEVRARLVLKHKIVVRAPYPEKFVKGKLHVHPDTAIPGSDPGQPSVASWWYGGFARCFRCSYLFRQNQVL